MLNKGTALRNWIVLAGITAMSDTSPYYTPVRDESDSRNRKPIPIPEGCKEYCFDRDGNYPTQQNLAVDTVFRCVASSEKVAVKKFQKWKARK